MERTRRITGWVAWLVVGAVGAGAACGSTDQKRRVSVADQGGAGGEPTERNEAGESSAAGGTPSSPSLGGGGGQLAEASAGAAGVAESGGAGQPTCENGAICLSDVQAAVCDEGVQAALDCSDGCAAGACLPSVLSNGWQLHQFALVDSAELTAQYSFSDDGLSALQAINAQPSVYFLDQVLTNVVVTGTFAVESTNDDDFIGLAFGWQDSEHFYLFDWKQLGQTSACGTADVGAMLKRYSGTAALTTCNQFWDSVGDGQFSVLVAADQNPTGWVDNTPYTFRLVHKPGDISLEVFQGTERVVYLESNDATYGSGKFGFYSCSQEQSRFELVEIQPAP